MAAYKECKDSLRREVVQKLFWVLKVENQEERKKQSKKELRKE